jgi:U6 snRNA-associated Sm-like protein LSm2
MQQLKQYSRYFAATDNYPARSFFKTLTNQVVTIELKNDIRIRGTLKSVDQYLNIKLDDIDVLDLDKYPHLSSVKNMFIRGSVVRYVVLPRSEVDVGLLEDATRRGMPSYPFTPTFSDSCLAVIIFGLSANCNCLYRGCEPGGQSSVISFDRPITINIMRFYDITPPSSRPMLSPRIR